MKHQIILILGSILFLYACNNQVGNQPIKKQAASESIEQNTFIEDSIFRRAINSLETINFYLAGNDSIVITNDPLTLVELNGVKNAFYSPFDEDDSGLQHYKQMKVLRKYHLKLKPLKKNNPSTNVIQLFFKTSLAAKQWYTIFENSPDKKVIENKPKTCLWLDQNNVYFIQTYNTPDKTYLYQLQSNLKKQLHPNQ